MNNAVRTNAAAQLEAFAQSNYAGYVSELIALINQSTATDIVLQAAGLAIRNSLRSRDAQKQVRWKQRWIALETQVKSYVRTQALAALESTNSRAPRIAAETIAAIATIDLPNGDWPELMPVLLAASASTEQDAAKTETRRASALQAIGLIAEDIEPSFIELYSNEILNAVVGGARSQETSILVRKTAMRALLHALPGVQRNFLNESERDYIMHVVCEAATSSPPEVQDTAFLTLVQIMDRYYELMEKYMQEGLFALTIAGMQSPEERIALQALEFWSTVCDKELELALDAEDALSFGETPEVESKQYAAKAIPQILPVLLQLLCQQNEDADEDDWNVHTAAALCLALFSKTVADPMVEPIIPFVEANIQSPEWRRRDAAVMAFGSILKGPTPENLAQLVAQALPTLIEMITDPVEHVKDTVVWALGEIATELPSTIKPDQHLPHLLRALVGALNDSQKVVRHVCACIERLAGEDFAPYYTILLTNLMSTADRQGMDSLTRTAAYEALAALVKTSVDSELGTTGNLTVQVLDRLEQTFKKQNELLATEDVNEWTELMANLLNVLGRAVDRLKGSVQPLADRIMTLLLQIITSTNKRTSLLEETYSAVGTVTAALREGFKPYLEAFLPFLFQVLRTKDDGQLCATATQLVGELARSIEGDILPFCNDFMGILLENLASADTSQKVKPFIISTFGDIAMAINQNFGVYLSHVMPTLQQAGTVQSANSDMYEYVRMLQESIIEGYAGICAAFEKDTVMLQPYVPDIFGFLQRLAESPDRTPEMVALSVGLIGDLANAYPNGEIKGALLQPWVNEVLKAGRARGMGSQARQTAKWAREKVNSATA